MGGVRTGYATPFLPACGQVLNVEPLDEESSRALLDDSGAHLDAAGREQILKLARGNPLALAELPGTWRRDSIRAVVPGSPVPLSARLEQAFVGRLGELATPTRDALLVAATDSDSALAEILAAASELAGVQLGIGALDTAVDAGLVTRRSAYRIPAPPRAVRHIGR